MVYTARIGDVVKGTVIDITVKNNKGHVFSPTWQMVLDFKNGKISWTEYERQYRELISNRFKTRKTEFIEIAKMAKIEDIVLICYCRDERFCHRRLAKEILLNLIEKGALA